MNQKQAKQKEAEQDVSFCASHALLPNVQVLKHSRESAEILVQRSSCCIQGWCRHVLQYSSNYLQSPSSCREPIRVAGIAIVHQRGTTASQMILKGDQTCIFGIRTAQIELSQSRTLGFANRLPEQKRHSSQPMIMGVRAAILVDDCPPVGQREDTGDGLCILRCYMDREVIAQARDESSEPRQRLWRNALPLTGHLKQMVKLGQLGF